MRGANHQTIIVGIAVGGCRVGVYTFVYGVIRMPTTIRKLRQCHMQEQYHDGWQNRATTPSPPATVPHAARLQSAKYYTKPQTGFLAFPVFTLGGKTFKSAAATCATICRE